MCPEVVVMSASDLVYLKRLKILRDVESKDTSQRTGED
jgi:hypothetical protein